MASGEIKDIMSEWLALKSQLKAARADISVLNRREKELRIEVQTYMKTEAADADVKIQDKKVSYQKKESKGSITKDVIVNGLRAFFGGNETQVEGAFQAILDAVPVKERDVITVRKA
jgi:hypothetical protein